MTGFAYDNPVKTVNDCIFFFILSLKVDFYCRVTIYVRKKCAKKRALTNFHFRAKTSYVICLNLTRNQQEIGKRTVNALKLARRIAR